MYCTREQLENEINKFVSAHRNEMIEGIATGILTDADLRKYEDDVVEAIQYGEEAAGKPPKLIASELLATERAPFKRFQAIRCKGRQLTIVYLCDNENHLECGLGMISLDKAREIAESGHKVHVLVKSSDGNTVDFEHGIWVHRIASKEVEKTDKAIELEIPDAAWRQSKAFLDELDRISLHRSIDVVHSAMTCLSGAVALLSNKYCLVTSLSPDDVAAIKPAQSAGAKESATHDKVSAVSRRFILKQSHGVFVACSVKDKALSDLNDYIDTRATVISCANSTEEIIHDYVKILDNKKKFVQFKLSIIIPVYNSEKYLHACLRPVLDQVDEGVEIIAIDDASEDNSLDILNYYCKRNANIKVLHNDTNLGPGPSRNYGLSQASGEYIAFLDSDDSVNESYFNEMLNSAEVHQSDIVFSNVDPEIPVFDDFSRDLCAGQPESG